MGFIFWQHKSRKKASAKRKGRGQGAGGEALGRRRSADGVQSTADRGQATENGLRPGAFSWQRSVDG